MDALICAFEAEVMIPGTTTILPTSSLSRFLNIRGSSKLLNWTSKIGRPKTSLEWMEE